MHNSQLWCRLRRRIWIVTRSEAFAVFYGSAEMRIECRFVFIAVRSEILAVWTILAAFDKFYIICEQFVEFAFHSGFAVRCVDIFDHDISSLFLILSIICEARFCYYIPDIIHICGHKNPGAELIIRIGFWEILLWTDLLSELMWIPADLSKKTNALNRALCIVNCELNQWVIPWRSLQRGLSIWISGAW